MTLYIDDGIHLVSMGGDLLTTKNELAVMIRFATPSVNNNGDRVRVDHVDLIAGAISGPVDSSDRKAYTNPSNPTMEILKRFSDNDWVEENGWYVIRMSVTCNTPTYYRLRGTNLAVGTPGEVDESGNPLMDEPGENTEEKAWMDLWFYSNPIFVYPR